MTEYKEIIVALIAVFGAVIPYLFQRNKEFKLKIADKKRDAYHNFLKNFTEMAVAIMHEKDVSGMESDKERMVARDQLLLYGSDDVIKAYDAWIRHADVQENDLNKEGDLIGSLFLSIRKDLLGKTKVTKEEISNLNPFNGG
jgi:hypothetical protein